MGTFNSCINAANIQLKLFPGCKAMQLDHHTIPTLQEQYYDAAGIHVGITICQTVLLKKVSMKLATISLKLLWDVAVTI